MYCDTSYILFTCIQIFNKQTHIFEKTIDKLALISLNLHCPCNKLSNSVITSCFVFLARREHLTPSCTFVEGILWIQLDSVHPDPGGSLLWVWLTDRMTCGWLLCLSALVSVSMYVATPNPLSITSCLFSFCS